DVTREEEDRTQQPEPDARQQVAAARAEKGTGARAAETGVVGGERDPRDRDRDHQVDALENGRPALAVQVPEAFELGALERPHGQVEQRSEYGPNCELADELPNEVDRPEQSERECDPAEEQRPQPL